MNRRLFLRRANGWFVAVYFGMLAWEAAGDGSIEAALGATVVMFIGVYVAMGRDDESGV